jgi:hypothetical protein
MEVGRPGHEITCTEEARHRTKEELEENGYFAGFSGNLNWQRRARNLLQNNHDKRR